MSTPQNRFLDALGERRRATEGAEELEGIGPSEPEIETQVPTIDNEFLDALIERSGGFRAAEVGSFERTFEDVGIVGAFSAGIKQGLLDPLTVFGVEVDAPRLDETSETVANILGSFVGLGIGFIPFAFGAGVVLKGIGLTKNIPRVITTAEGIATPNPLYGFIRNTLAGSVQIAGTSEEAADVPVNLAIGATFGAAIEGLFLARALRGRRGAAGTSRFTDDGSPHPDNPIDLDVANKEIVIAPNNASHGVARIRTEIRSLFEEDRPYDEALTLLAQEHAETIRIPGLADTKPVVTFARQLYPEAQILERSTQAGKVKEVLVHNPVDPEDVLSAKQIQQWRAQGFAENQEILYGSPAKAYRATGIPAAEGRIQLQDPLKPRVVFAPKIEETTRPLVTRFFSESSTRRATLQRAIVDNESTIGITIPSAVRSEGAAMTAKRGLVDVSEFEEVASFRSWLETHRNALADITASSQEEAIEQLARTLGIKGLVIKEAGITQSVRVFDQEAVSFIAQPPRPAARTTVSEVTGVEVLEEIPNVGLALDSSVTSLGPNGETLLHSFEPSWRSSISSALRRQGVAERDIPAHLDMFAQQMEKRLDSLLDDEFLAMKNASEITFGECV